MAGETNITLVGNLTADPELRFTPSGAAVANFTVASTPRTFDRQTSEWKDGDAMFLNCSVWRQAAENVAESLTKGMRVVVSGRLKSRSYETREGERRTVFEVEGSSGFDLKVAGWVVIPGVAARLTDHQFSVNDGDALGSVGAEVVVTGQHHAGGEAVPILEAEALNGSVEVGVV